MRVEFRPASTAPFKVMVDHTKQRQLFLPCQRAGQVDTEQKGSVLSFTAGPADKDCMTLSILVKILSLFGEHQGNTKQELARRLLRIRLPSREIGTSFEVSGVTYFAPDSTSSSGPDDSLTVSLSFCFKTDCHISSRTASNGENIRP